MQNNSSLVKIKFFLIFIFYLIFTNFTYAQPGALDLTYGRGGIVTTGKISEIIVGIAVQTDGKILVGGYNTVNGDYTNTEFCLSRYFQNGFIDTTFGYRGIVQTAFPGTFARGFAVVIQTDGKIILAGQNYSEYALARYNSNGSLDSTFGVSGLVSVDVGGHPDEVRSVVLQPDGKILVSGQGRVNLMRDFSIARFESNGDFDLTFGNQGKVIVSIAPSGQEYCEGMVLQPDGKIIAAGSYFNGTDQDFAVVRYNSNGSLDTTFGTGGISTLQISNTPDYCTSVLLQSDGKIVLGGITEYMNDSTKTSFARLLPNGTIDSLFGNAGISHPVNTTQDYVSGIKFDSNERIVVLNYGNSFRCLNDGSLDLSYGISGISTRPYGIFNDLVVLPDEKIIFAGYRLAGWNWNVLITKVDSSGAIDSTFGVNGTTEYDFGVPFNLYSYDMEILDDDKTVMMGSYIPTSLNVQGVAIARYDSIGHLDRTFGNGGIAITLTDAEMYTFEEQSDGKFIAGGRSAQYNYGLMRFETDGSLDSTFGINGSVNTPQIQTNSNSIGINSLVLQSDEKIVVSGFGLAGLATVRYLQDGTLDSTFSGDGIVIDNFSGPNNASYDLKLQYDGKLVVAGEFYNGNNNYAMGILRYNTDGTPDLGFGVNGKVEITHLDGIRANDLFILPDHKILITGSTLLFNNYEVILLKLNEDGSLDTTFAPGGMITTSLSSFNDYGVVVLVQSDGKIIIGATFYGIHLIRYNSDGTLDPGFGIGGIVTIDIGSEVECTSVAFQNDGKIMFGGTVNEELFILARFDSSGVLSSMNEFPLTYTNTNHLSPNPSNGEFNLLNARNKTVNIEIFSTDGKLVFKKQKHPASQTLSTNLNAGFYFVKVLDGGREWFQKIVIVKK